MFRELIEQGGMTAYPIAALVVFVVVFLLVVGRALLRTKAETRADAALPLGGESEEKDNV